jgi:hypothetical protein
MPKSPMAHHAGNINMKGKKYKVLKCGCCACEDYRDKELKKEHTKEVQSYISNSQDLFKKISIL